MSRKGIILAGGKGTRLMPATAAVSKQILTIYDKPMIYYPLSVLMLAGINEILIISSGEHLPSIRETIEKIGPIGIAFSFAVQKESLGIAEALIIAEPFLSGDDCALILGDNLFFGHGLSQILRTASQNTDGATLFVYPVQNPFRYGVLDIDEKGEIKDIVEKPKQFISNLAVTGLYFFDGTAAKHAKTLTPSHREELEITDLNKIYLLEKKLSFYNFGRGFAWLDAGTPESLLDAANFVATIERRQGIKISAPEEIAFLNGWIDKTQFLSLPALSYNNEYGQYLRGLVKRTNAN